MRVPLIVYQRCLTFGVYIRFVRAFMHFTALSLVKDRRDCTDYTEILLLFAKAKKLYMERFFHDEKNREEENCIEYKIYQKFYPAFNAGKRHQYRCEGICNNNRTEYSDKKKHPFFDRIKIHTRNRYSDYLNFKG